MAIRFWSINTFERTSRETPLRHLENNTVPATAVGNGPGQLSRAARFVTLS